MLFPLLSLAIVLFIRTDVQPAVIELRGSHCEFEQTFGTLLADLGIEGVDMAALARLNRGTVPLRWPAYAGDEWFSAIEAECERILAIYFAGLRSRD